MQEFVVELKVSFTVQVRVLANDYSEASEIAPDLSVMLGDNAILPGGNDAIVGWDVEDADMPEKIAGRVRLPNKDTDKPIGYAVQDGVCTACGRDAYEEDSVADGECPADDCPSNNEYAVGYRHDGEVK